MDTEFFLQCLKYIDLTSQKKTLVEQYLPVFSALGGVATGFLINKLADVFKNRTENATKKIVIRQEVERIQGESTTALRGAVSILQSCARNSRPQGFFLPLKIPTYCIDEFFVGLCHKYTKNERHNMFTIMKKVETVTKAINELVDEQPEDLNHIRNMTLNIFSSAEILYSYCSAFLEDKSVDIERSPLDTLKTLNIDTLNLKF